MHIELGVMFAGLLVGFVVGLTGMGGGALMTPVLVLLFRINPLAAVSSDIVGGGGDEAGGRRGAPPPRHGERQPRALARDRVGAGRFCGVFVLRAIGAPEFGERLKILLGAVLLVAAAAIGAKSFLQSRRPIDGGMPHDPRCGRPAPSSSV